MNGWDHQFLSRPPGFYRETGLGMLLKKIRFALAERARFQEYQVAFRRGEILARNGSFTACEEKCKDDSAGEPSHQAFRHALSLIGRSGHDRIEDTEKGRGLPGLKMTAPAFIMKAGAISKHKIGIRLANGVGCPASHLRWYNRTDRACDWSASRLAD